MPRPTLCERRFVASALMCVRTIAASFPLLRQIPAKNRKKAVKKSRQNPLKHVPRYSRSQTRWHPVRAAHPTALTTGLFIPTESTLFGCAPGFTAHSFSPFQRESPVSRWLPECEGSRMEPKTDLPAADSGQRRKTTRRETTGAPEFKCQRKMGKKWMQQQTHSLGIRSDVPARQRPRKKPLRCSAE